MHLSILYSIEYSKSKSNNGEAFITFKDFPIIYEIDRICETYNPLLDFISNYKFIVNAKILLCAKYNWYYIECYMRIFKLPYYNAVRDLI